VVIFWPQASHSRKLEFSAQQRKNGLKDRLQACFTSVAPTGSGKTTFAFDSEVPEHELLDLDR
jgi:reverse gyrase